MPLTFCRPATIRSIALACLLVSGAPVRGEDPAAPADQPAAIDHFAHLNHKPGGPQWSIDSIAATLPANKQAMWLDPKKPIPPVTDAEAALKAAIELLAGQDKAGYDFAYRVVGATVSGTKAPNAIKLFAYLQHHGIGTRADAGSAVRTSLQLVKAGDQEASEFVALADPTTFTATATRAPSIRKLLANHQSGAFRLDGPIAIIDGDNKMTLRTDGDLVVELPQPIDRVKKGRVMSVAGFFDGEKMQGLVASVPEPSVSFEWKLNRQTVRNNWHLSTVSVSVHNKGLQAIKDLRFKVRCWNRSDAHTQTATIDDLAPGKSTTVSVDFSMYDWYWGVTSGDPSAEVTVEKVDW